MNATNLHEIAAAIRSSHAHVDVRDVNDHRLVLAVNEDPYPWHEHPDSDELFIVLEGVLRLETAGGQRTDLGASDALLVPAGTPHRTTPLPRCVNVVVKRADAGTRFLDRAESSAERS